jgi:hypothetical protein
LFSIIRRKRKDQASSFALSVDVILKKIRKDCIEKIEKPDYRIREDFMICTLSRAVFSFRK